LRSGIPGTVVKPAIGSKLAVSFLNGDPTKPIVDPIFDSTKAQSVAFSAGGISLNGGTNGVARGGSLAGEPVGDTIVAGYVVLNSFGIPTPAFSGDWLTAPPVYPGTSAGVIAATSAAAALTPPGTVFTLTGTISSGSSSVTCGG
jgi:hypothetical protein